MISSEQNNSNSLLKSSNQENIENVDPNSQIGKEIKSEKCQTHNWKPV